MKKATSWIPTVLAVTDEQRSELSWLTAIPAASVRDAIQAYLDTQMLLAKPIEPPLTKTPMAPNCLRSLLAQYGRPTDQAVYFNSDLCEPDVREEVRRRAGTSEK